MNTSDFTELSTALCDACHVFGEREWCLATGGNFSVRAGAKLCLITQSGKDKSRLSAEDLMLCSLDGKPLEPALKPSAETALHVWLYNFDSDIAAVLHTHSVASTVVSRRAGAALRIRDFEMQKALRGIKTHDTELVIPVLENSQDMTDLTRQMISRLGAQDSVVHGFLVRGHGLYAWGNSLAEAQQHLEGLEFLLKCAMLEGTS